MSEVATVAASTPEAAPNAGASNQPASQPGQPIRVTSSRPSADKYAEGFMAALNKPREEEPAAEAAVPAPEAPLEQQPVAEAAPAVDPVTGQPIEQPATDQSQQAQAATVPEEGEVPPDDFEPAGISEALRRVNSDVRRMIKGSMYRDAEYKKLGFTVDHARFYANAGFTPERATKILQRMPTAEDDDRVFSMADAAVRIEQDYKSNPEGFLGNLEQADPNAFRAFVAKAAERYEQVVPEVRRDRTVNTAKQLINVLKTRGTNSKNEVLVAAAQILEEDMFGPGGIEASAAEPQIPEEVQRRLAAYEQEIQRVREAQQNLQRQRVVGFQSSVVQATQQGLAQHLKGMIDQTRLPLADEDKNTWIGSVLESVRRDFVNTPDLVTAFNLALTNGNFDQRHGQNATAFALDRAKRLALPHFNAEFQRYKRLVGGNRSAPPPPPAGAPQQRTQQPAAQQAAVPQNVMGSARPANPAPPPPRTTLPRGRQPDVDSYFKGLAATMMAKLGGAPR